MIINGTNYTKKPHLKNKLLKFEKLMNEHIDIFMEQKNPQSLSLKRILTYLFHKEFNYILENAGKEEND